MHHGLLFVSFNLFFFRNFSNGKLGFNFIFTDLDEHGEEDRDLRRGKPLFLNQQRYNLLQSTWASHSFDYQSLKWYNASLFIY